ncbi:MAG: SET domain-containing protein-lysine N-methyltransferase [Candidatus Pacebacteria bacterium]|nr:SET domain-containing protein-lysine N-methyltransferase [Candidatus Paceibacterota bacterium]
MDLYIEETRNGKGICAARAFAAGETLYEVTGVFITGDVDEEIDETTRNNAFRYDENRYISPAGSIGDFQNHACEPNAKVARREDKLFVVAINPIQKGEEVMIDYSTIIGSDDEWEMTCNCAAASCRGTIKSFDTLPHALQQRYIEQDIVPAYMRAL